MAWSLCYSAGWNIVVWTGRATHQNKRAGSCLLKKKKERQREKINERKISDLEISWINGASFSAEPLTGSSLSWGKTRVRRWELNSGVTAYISLALSTLQPCRAESVQVWTESHSSACLILTGMLDKRPSKDTFYVLLLKEFMSIFDGLAVIHFWIYVKKYWMELEFIQNTDLERVNEGS